nr:hypothetical protein [Nitrospinota bacterium]
MSSLSQRGNFSTRYRQKNFRRTFHKKKFFPWQRYRKLTYKNPKHSFIVFNENPYFDTLDDFEKLFALMFWVKRHCNHSEAELSQDLGLTKKNVHILLAYAELTGIIKVKKQFRVVKNKRKKTETQTRMPTRPHRIVTSKGKKFLKAIVEQAWKGKPIPANLKPGIHIVNG